MRALRWLPAVVLGLVGLIWAVDVSACGRGGPCGGGGWVEPCCGPYYVPYYGMPCFGPFFLPVDSNQQQPEPRKPTPKPVPRPAEGDKVHAVIVVDTVDPEFLDFTKKAGESVLTVLDAHLGKGAAKNVLGTTVTLDGADANRTKILETIKDLPAKSGDTVFVFYNGHGASDDKGHHFLLPAGEDKKLYRSEVVEAMNKNQPRLRILLSDACNTSIESSARVEVASFGDKTVSKSIRDLFTRHEGIMDMNSASEKEQAWATVFAPAFVNSCGHWPIEGAIWDQFIPSLQKEMAKRYEKVRKDNPENAELKKQENQTLKVYQTPRYLGVELTQAPDRYPAARVTVELPAEAVLTFNGQRMAQTGATREFTTPELASSDFFHYSVEATLVVEGTTLTRRCSVPIQTGQVTRVQFGNLSAPAVVLRPGSSPPAAVAAAPAAGTDNLLTRR